MARFAVTGLIGLLLIAMTAPGAEQPAPVTRPSPATAATTTTAPAGLEVTIRAVERDGVRFCEWSVVNHSMRAVTIPRGPSGVRWIGPPDEVQHRDLGGGAGEVTFVGGNRATYYRHVGRITLFEWEGYTKRRELGPLKPGAYKLSVSMEKGFEHLAPKEIKFEVHPSPKPR